MRGMLLLVMSVTALCLAAAPAKAELYSFECITSSTSTDAGIGEAQFSVEVIQGEAPNQVFFRFENTGPDNSSITDIYFYDGAFLQSGAVGDSYGDVAFSGPAAPEELPGLPKNGATSAFFSLDSDPAVQPNGINPDEWLEILFSLKGQTTFEQMIAALEAGIANPMGLGTMTIGIRAQGFADGGSESFVHVPLPAAALLGLLGLGAAGLKLRKFG